MRDLDLDLIRRSATAGRSTATAARTPTTTWCGRDHARCSGGTVVSADRVGRGRRAGRRRDHRRGASRPGTPPSAVDLAEHRRHRDRRDRQVRRSRAASTVTPTWSCRSAAPSPRTPSRPARRRPRGAGRRRSSTSPCSAPASACRTGSPRGTQKAAGQLRDRLRLPPDRRRRRRRVAQGDGRAGRRGRHQLQAVHGLPRRLLQRRRPDPAGHADGRGQRLDDHDARRERHRHRRARRAGAGPRRDRPDQPRAHPAVGDRGGGHPPRDHAGPPHRRPALRRAHVGQAGGRHARGRRATRAGTSSARPARSTSTSRSRSSSARRASRARSGSARTPLRSRAEGHQDELWRYLRTDDLSVVSTDHCPFCFKEQKELGIGDFSKIPNGIGVRRAPDGPALPGRRRRSDHPRALGRALLAPPRPGCSACTRARA